MLNTISLEPVRNNYNIVHIKDLVLHFSYKTLVAIADYRGRKATFYKTNVKYSVTTTRRMNEAGCRNYTEVDQDILENMVKGLIG